VDSAAKPTLHPMAQGARKDRFTASAAADERDSGPLSRADPSRKGGQFAATPLESDRERRK
jgi:hypothetical protein